ncbi:MAG: TolC family protein [Armatimonadetes bacterium]|nr:TolC family protein [Armatimonadota bacterium]
MSLLMALAMAAAVAQAQPAEGPVTLTMQDAVQLALQQNRTVLKAAAAVKEAQAALDQARAAQRFTLSGEARIARQAPASSLTMPVSPSQVERIDILPAMSWNLGLTAVKPLYHGGQLYYQKQLASLGLDTARLSQRRERQDVGRQVRTLFLQALQAQEMERVAAENVSRAARHLQDAQARVEAQVAPGFDVIRAEAEVANANDGLVAARAAVDNILAALKTLLAIDVTREVKLQAPELGGEVEADPADAIAKALRQRPEVAAADKAVRLAEAQIGLARATNNPSVDLFANYSKVSTSGFAGHDWNWMIGLQAKQLIFDNGLERSAVKQAEAKKAQAEETAKQIREAVALEVYQAWVNLKAARERIAAAEKGVAQAEEAMRIADLRYREGVGPAVEVTDARAALIAARSNLVNARFAYEQAKVELEYATGRPIDEFVGAASGAQGSAQGAKAMGQASKKDKTGHAPGPTEQQHQAKRPATGQRVPQAPTAKTTPGPKNSQGQDKADSQQQSSQRSEDERADNEGPQQAAVPSELYRYQSAAAE